MPRKATRADETRGAVTRARTSRQMPKSAYQGRLYVPPHIIPKDKVYAYVAEYVLNEPNARMRDKLLQGWSPVPADRHPELVARLPDEEMPTIIRNGGLVLVERSKRDVEEDRAALREENRDVIQSIRWTGQEFGDTPTFEAENEVGIERVRSPGSDHPGNPIKD